MNSELSQSPMIIGKVRLSDVQEKDKRKNVVLQVAETEGKRGSTYPSTGRLVLARGSGLLAFYFV